MDSAATVEWEEAKVSLREVVERLRVLLCTVGDSSAQALGGWSIAEVAMHLSQVGVALTGLARQGEPFIRDIRDLGDLTTSAVESDPERDLTVLADRIEGRALEFLGEMAGCAPSEARPWLVKGSTVPLSALTCHFLNEAIVHGYDIARAAGQRWPIEPSHAAMVLSRFIVPVLRTLDPRALVDQTRAAGLRATYDIRIRRGQRFSFAFADGELRVEDSWTRRVDCHLSVDPVAFLLVIWGRQSQWPAIAKGQLTAWGRKPWLGPRLRSLTRNP
ncbi:MAG: maleylpyruvate isomerase N-terminal domain-containing protein [Egibacteraceae bacterium]